MPDPLAVTVLTRKAGRACPDHGLRPAPRGSATPATFAFDGVEAVEIVAP